MSAAPELGPAPVRVLIVDDSPFMRLVLRRILSEDDRFRVVGTASDGLDALAQARELQPDVITMDVEMPRLDGVSAVRELMRVRPTPVVMVSTLTRRGAETTLRALEVGAVDYVAKPSGDARELVDLADELRSAVLRAATSRPRSRPASAAPAPVDGRPRDDLDHGPADTVVVIGASTGGPPALTEVVAPLPHPLDAAVVIVQHMPPPFTEALARRLDRLSPLPVREAADQDGLWRNAILVAPADYHLAITPERSVRLERTPARHGVRPSVDVTLECVPSSFGSRSVAVVLTGMGRDGAEGARAVEEAGGTVIVQDEASSVIYGMPKAAKEATRRAIELPLEAIPTAIAAAVKKVQGKGR